MTPNVTRPAVAAPAEAANSQNRRGSPAHPCPFRRLRPPGAGRWGTVPDGAGSSPVGRVGWSPGRKGRDGGVADPRTQQEQQRDRRSPGDGQHGHRRPQCTAQGRDGRDQQRPGERADLVQRLVHREPPAEADGRGRVGQQRRLRRAAHRLAGALGQDERAGQHETGRTDERRQRQRGDAHGGQRVAAQGERPVAAGAVGQGAEDQPQHQRQGLTGAGDQAHQQGRCAQGGQQGPGDRPGALVDHVRRQAHHAEADDGPPRRPPGRPGHRRPRRRGLRCRRRPVAPGQHVAPLVGHASPPSRVAERLPPAPGPPGGDQTPCRPRGRGGDHSRGWWLRAPYGGVGTGRRPPQVDACPGAPSTTATCSTTRTTG